MRRYLLDALVEDLLQAIARRERREVSEAAAATVAASQRDKRREGQR